MQEQNKLNLIRKDGQMLVKVIHMRHAGTAEVNITDVGLVFCVDCNLKLLLEHFYLASGIVHCCKLAENVFTLRPSIR